MYIQGNNNSSVFTTYAVFTTKILVFKANEIAQQSGGQLYNNLVTYYMYTYTYIYLY